MSGWELNSDKVSVGANTEKNKKRNNNVSKSSNSSNKQTGGIVFTECYHNSPNPVANNVFVSPTCELCKIDTYFATEREAETRAFEILKLKMEEDERKKRVTFYYIKNSYITLSATIPPHLVNQHNQLVYFIQTFIWLIIIIIFIAIIYLIFTIFVNL